MPDPQPDAAVVAAVAKSQGLELEAPHAAALAAGLAPARRLLREAVARLPFEAEPAGLVGVLHRGAAGKEAGR